MTPRQAEKLAQQMWGSETRLGRARRGRRSPRYSVGYADTEGGRAVVMGTSDVDWESAFAIAAGLLR